jgi:methyltransferase (TIGR00027 family)
MQEQPSRTAMATAAARAAHLVVDRPPFLFEDTLAATLLGTTGRSLIASHQNAGPAQAPALACMRVAMTARSAYAEDRAAQAVHRGVGQCVILGAGLDSFAYRSPLAARLVIFEVDHPATQAWKAARLHAGAVPIPDTLRLVPVDFTVDSLADRLTAAGFDRSRPAFLTWLGVTQYMSTEAISRTLDVLTGFAPGTELVMEYLQPARLLDHGGQALAEFFMPKAAAAGEPWITFLTTAQARELGTTHGWRVVEDVGRHDQVEASLWQRRDALRPHELGRLLHMIIPAANAPIGSRPSAPGET